MEARLLWEQEDLGSTPRCPTLETTNGSLGLVVQALLITRLCRVRSSGLPLTTDDTKEKHDAAAIETHTPDRFMGLWCNWQHDGLLIRSARVRTSPAPLAAPRLWRLRRVAQW